MTGFHAWDDVKREVFDAEDLDVIDAGAQRMVAEVRAHRLAEMRRARSTWFPVPAWDENCGVGPGE
ncbi:hypothetical protein AB4212_14710 [Streptomyces sp. 2MCAF27]